MNTYVIVNGCKYRVIKGRKQIHQGLLNYEPGQGPMGYSREMDCLALAAEISFTNSLTTVPTVLQVLKTPAVVPWLPPGIPA